MPLEVPLLYRIVLVILGFLFFHMKLIIVLSRFVKNCIGILIGIALNPQIAFGRIAIFTTFILPIQEHGRFFHFLVSSSLSFFKDLKFLMKQVFHFLVSVNPGYFIVYVAIVKGEVSLISLSAYLAFLCRRATDIFELILYPATSLFLCQYQAVLQLCNSA